MDAFSEALNAVRMTGAIFYSLDCAAPWGFAVPHLRDVAHILAPGTERLVSYHLVTEGRAVVQFGDDAPIEVKAGEVLIIPHGDAHTVSNGSPAQMIDSGATLREHLTGTLTAMHYDGGGGERTRFICGYFGCERHADRLFLAGLPIMIKIDIRADQSGQWIESSIRHLTSDETAHRPGHAVLRAKASEALFVEALRRYMEALPPEHAGWLAAARDPIVSAVLALIHRQPFHAWSIDGLAAAAGTSRSVLSERFARYLDEAPLGYLSRWRLQLAARLLETSQKSVQQVATETGYESEASFNRAFKREFASPPARYRKRHVVLAQDRGQRPGLVAFDRRPGEPPRSAADRDVDARRSSDDAGA
jgi:AraC-like DNA-binding protein